MSQSRKRKKKPESRPIEAAPTTAAEPVAPSPSAVVATLAGIAAVWSAAGSLGLMSHALRHGISWLGLGVLLVAAWPRGEIRNRSQLAGLAVAIAASLLMTASSVPVYNVLAITLMLAVLAKHAGPDRRLLEITSLATAVLAVYRLGLVSIPTIWSLAEALGRLLGEVSETIFGRPLALGESFAGLDFLVLMFALCAAWLVRTPAPRLVRGVLAALGILAGHFAYLYVLSCSHDLIAALPEVPPSPTPNPYEPPAWQWSEAVRTLLPWNLPLFAGVIHLGIAGAMFRWSGWLPDPEKEDNASAERPAWRTNLVEYGPAALALVIPLLTSLTWGVSDLKDTKIVALERGYLDWLKPRHDEYGRASAGMYGMLPIFVESLGGEFVRSDDLAESDLADADVLLLIHPNHDWPADQLERVWDFVRRGGSLLVAAEPTMFSQDGQSSFNRVLEPTQIEVRTDTAISQIGQWEQSLLPLAHPANIGVDPDRGQFGQRMGSSLDVTWPATPILVGRWGSADPGSDAVHTGAYSYDPGEKLGDLVLAAEGRLGKGRVIVVGDTAPLSNQVIGRSYPFVGRILAYLAGRSSNPQAGWRQLLGIAACLALIGLFFVRTDCDQLATVAVVLTLSLWGVHTLGERSSRVLPDGRTATPNNLAYIDASHLEAHCDEPWAGEGVDGLSLTLMRNGYLPLLAFDFGADRVARSSLVVSIAPARSFSSGERRTVRQFIEAGGVFVSTVGAEHARPSEPLLTEFGFEVAPTHLRAGEQLAEPAPFGCFLPVYLESSGQLSNMMLYAAWPIGYPESGGRPLAYGHDESPVAAIGYVGEGAFVLIGDSSFAMNKNLERVDGEPLYGNYDNSDFWRWLVGHLTDRPEWTPPNREPAAEPELNPPDQSTAEDASGGEDSP